MSTSEFILEKFNLKKDLPIRLPGVSRKHLTVWLRELGFKVGVEVGTAQGKFLRSLCFENPTMKFYAVDPWLVYEGYPDVQAPEMNRIIKGFPIYMAPYSNYEVIKKYSMDAVKDFEDNSIDFVYIDANHEDPYVTQDITEWTKKVKSGGIVAGHDYITKELDGFHWDWDVVTAVNKYVKKNKIKYFFVLGLDEKVPGMTREPSRSWMFIKP